MFPPPTTTQISMPDSHGLEIGGNTIDEGRVEAIVLLAHQGFA